MPSGGGMGGMTPGASSIPPAPGVAMPMAPSYPTGGQDYETVVAQTPAYNTTVYVGNLIPYSTQADLYPLFQVRRTVMGLVVSALTLAPQGYGYIVEIRMQADRGFAFVKLDTHEHAAQAICNLQNYQVHGRPIKCSWGKDREGGAGPAGAVSPAMGMPTGAVQQPGMNMGMMGYNPMVSRLWVVADVANPRNSSRCTACRRATGSTIQATTTRLVPQAFQDSLQARHLIQPLSKPDGECKIRQRRHTTRQINGAPTMAAKLRANNDRHGRNRCNAICMGSGFALSNTTWMFVYVRKIGVSWASGTQGARPGNVVGQADTRDGWQLEIRQGRLFLGSDGIVVAAG